ncbi:MAG: alpha/beta fold hydrolase [Gammaproteobacteria bacterium]|nr:alpha/beta fold hydrolase [Gammaproteobacteria bacterium]
MMSDTLYWESDNNGKTPMLMVHGFLSSRAQWLRNRGALREVCCPVPAELWGHGRSPAPSDPALYSPDAYVEQFETIRKILGVERWFLCGQSLGASLTMRYALKYPERVLAHVFTNSSSLLADESLLAQRRVEAAQSIEDIRSEGMTAVEAYRVHPAKARRLPQDVYDALVQDAKSINPQAIAEFLHHTNLHASLRDKVAHSRVPSLLVVGRYEKRFAKFRQYAEQVMPTLEVQELDAGHAVNAEAWEGFNQHVTAFLQAHDQ